ncbi:MAG: glyoxylate/hydroxypyruvate reductase A [Casimicrobiaceae bacterium]
MNLLYYTAADDGASWREAIARELPEATLRTWPKSGAPADYALVWRPPTALLDELISARAVFNLGAGVDAVVGLSPWPAGVPLIRLEDAGMAEQMVEYVAYAVLRRYREFDVYEQAQRVAQWRPRARLDKRAFAVGILGCGVLGIAVAEALNALGFAVTAWSRSHKHLQGVRSYAQHELDAFLATCSVLVCMLPLTAQTRGLLTRSRLALLPKGAYVINVARGALIVENDLLALVDADHLSGAMLDVFHDEPLARTHAFWHHARITVTPHISAATRIDESVRQVAAKIRRLEAGLPVSGVVDAVHAY